MASLDTLEERLATLQETTSQLRDLINRLANLNFQPGSAPLPDQDPLDDDASVATHEGVASELSAEISQILREEEEELELFQEDVTDARSGRAGSETAERRQRLKEGATEVEGELRRCRVSFRKAQLAAKHSLRAAQRLERSILVASHTRPSTTQASRSGATSPDLANSGTLSPPNGHQATARRRLHGHTKNHTRNLSSAPADPLLSASSTLTTSLRRTHTLVASELARSLASRETLDESTNQLKQLHSSYSSLDDMLVSSKDLLGTLWRSQKSDGWYLTTTFWMLAGTAGWLVFRRFLWIGWVVVRLCLGLGWRTGKGVGGLVFGGKGSGGSAGMSEDVNVGDVGEGGGKVTVRGIPEEGAVPTIQVGQGGHRVEKTSDGSMVEEIGNMIDESMIRPSHQEAYREAHQGRHEPPLEVSRDEL